MESVASRFGAVPIRLPRAKIVLKAPAPDPALSVYSGVVKAPAKLPEVSPVSSEPLPYAAAFHIPVNPPAYCPVHVCDECPRVIPEFQYPASNYVRVPDYKAEAVNAPGELRKARFQRL
jgi:hypothetical protein